MPSGFYSQKLWGFISWCWNPRLHSLACSWDCSLPRCPSQFLSTTHECGTTCSSSHCCHSLTTTTLCSPPWLPISTPPTCLDEHFFFKSLVVGLPYSLFFWQLWLFLVLKLVVILLVVVWGHEAYLPMPPPWPELKYFKTMRLEWRESSLQNEQKSLNALSKEAYLSFVREILEGNWDKRGHILFVLCPLYFVQVLIHLTYIYWIKK